MELFALIAGIAVGLLLSKKFAKMIEDDRKKSLDDKK